VWKRLLWWKWRKNKKINENYFLSITSVLSQLSSSSLWDIWVSQWLFSSTLSLNLECDSRFLLGILDVSWDLSLELRSDMALGSSKMFLRNIPWVISLLWLGDGSWCRICSHTAILHALTARLQQSSSSWESSCRNRWSVGSVRFGSNLIDLGWFKLDLHGLMAHLMVNGNWFHCFLCDIAVGAALFLLGVLSLNLKSDSEIPWALVFYVMPGWFHPGLGKILLSHCRILLVNALWILDRWALMAILISNGSCSTVFFVIVAIAVPPMCFWLLKWV